MNTRTAVPSPRGSNLERLFFTKHPIALDAAPDDSNSKITALAVLVAQLDPDEKAMLLQMLKPADTLTDPDDDSPAMDAKPILRPTQSFTEMFPNAKRLLNR